jgi:hypothetical protein
VELQRTSVSCRSMPFARMTSPEGREEGILLTSIDVDQTQIIYGQVSNGIKPRAVDNRPTRDEITSPERFPGEPATRGFGVVEEAHTQVQFTGKKVEKRLAKREKGEEMKSGNGQGESVSW